MLTQINTNFLDTSCNFTTLYHTSVRHVSLFAEALTTNEKVLTAWNATYELLPTKETLTALWTSTVDALPSQDTVVTTTISVLKTSAYGAIGTVTILVGFIPMLPAIAKITGLFVVFGVTLRDHGFWPTMKSASIGLGMGFALNLPILNVFEAPVKLGTIVLMAYTLFTQHQQAGQR